MMLDKHDILNCAMGTAWQDDVSFIRMWRSGEFILSDHIRWTHCVVISHHYHAIE